MKFKFLLAFTFIITFIHLEGDAQNQFQRNNLVPDKTKINTLKQKLESDQSERKKLAIEFAKKNGLESGKIYRNDRVIEIQKITSENTPLYYTTFNINAAKTTGASSLWTGGLSGLDLNGESMTLGLWDGDAVRTTHQEFGGRVTLVDGIRFSSSNSGTEHATHVAGTLIAAGVSDSAKGMASAALLRASDWNSDESEMTAFAAGGYLISSHSYGYSTDSRDGWPNWRFGYYDDTAEAWDEISFAAPYYLIVKAAGNDGNDGKNTSRNGYDLLEGAGTAKNVLVVGAVDDVLNYTGSSSVELAYFSSTGPTDDGRIKPDIVGNGVDVWSSFSGGNSDYESLSGTSMATPNVAGSLILLQQHYNNLNNAFMRSATLRGLVIHSAKEAGSNPGPDYKYGWGLLDVKAAAETISENKESTLIEEHTLNNGESFQKIIVADGLSPLVLTICWTDPKGTPLTESITSQNSTSKLLVNDLDCRLTSSTSTYSPWTLNPNNLSASASSGDNSIDNVEKIEISNPAYGEYTITINHKGSLTNGAQNFSLIVSGIVPSSCNPVKPDNFAANDITDQSAIISWDPLLGVNNYQGRYREKGMIDWNNFEATSNNATLTNLLAGTIYEVEMQSLCSTVDISGFTNPFTFQTECRPDVPENITYSNITTSSIKLKWDTVRAIQSYDVRYRVIGSATWQTETSNISSVALSGLSSGETYEFQVQSQCSENSNSSFSASVEFTPYCIASGGSSENEWIQLVQFGSINNESGNNGGYADFSSWVTDLQRDSEVEIGLQAGQLTNFPKYWNVWIDFNHNGLFTDTGEKVLTSQADADNLTLHQFNIPASALLGETLLRVSMKYNQESGSCESYAYGETEDYTVNIQEEISNSNFTPIIGKTSTDITYDQNLTIYPNPSSANISLNLTSELSGTKISIVDISGNVLFTSSFESRMIVDISAFSSGVYIVQVETTTGIEVSRFMKI
ncbi:S8 family serine peptidase [Reichenbachiella sp. MALMAid0571]|uniref:S8 family serine peptidase n=1 Tax=Reichenbachiella sp. MALMAid0571 TaxID=3143939 RepID=UPI0032DE813F